MRQSWGFRVVRAAVFAAICVLLAALGHVLMAGTAIPWWTIAATFPAVGLAAWALAGRERGVPVVVLGTVVAQTALHTMFSLAQTAQPVALPQPPPDPHAMHHMGHDAMPMATDGAHLHHAMQTGVEAGSPAVHQMTGTASLGMLIAHLVAALLCGLWLAYGERAAFRILGAAASRILLSLRLIFRPPVPLHRPRVRHDQTLKPFRQYLLVHAITSRGPPRGVAVS